MLYFLITLALSAQLDLQITLESEHIPAVLPWEEWKSVFSKEYSATEHDARRAVYEKNVKAIEAHNAEGYSWTLGVNQFSDLTSDEFAAIYLSPFNRTRKYNIVKLNGTAPETIDWRTQGAVTPVKNQEQCGSCWAFSTTGSTEGAIAIKTGHLISLSEQQLVDCAKREGNHGCQGGLMDYGFKYIMDNAGIDTEEDYPYTARNGVCNTAKAARHAATVSSYQDVTPQSLEQMKLAVAKGPVSIAVEADKTAFQHYKSGVLDNALGCGTKLDHGVLTVGYDDTYSTPYFTVKNSWGATWGENGYIRMAQTSGKGMCGMLSQPSYPIAGSAPSPGPTPKPGPTPTPSGPYEKPPCGTGEQEVQIQGVDGSFCTSKCNIFNPCEAAPTGITAQAQCALQDSSTHMKYCALICDPDSSTACDPSAGMTCKSIQTVGVCTWD